MKFAVFTSDNKEVFHVPLPNGQEAGIACCKNGESNIELGKIYGMTEYDLLYLRPILESNDIQLALIDVRKLNIQGLPEFRNELIPLSKKDISPTPERPLSRVLVVEGLGINVLDMMYRGAAWRGLYKEIMEQDCVCKLNFSASAPFAKYRNILLNNGVSDRLHFSVMPLPTLLEYDFVIDDGSLGSLSFSHTVPFKEQVSSFVEGFENMTVAPLSLGPISTFLNAELDENKAKKEYSKKAKELDKKIHELTGSKGKNRVVLLNGQGEFKHQIMPIEVQELIVKTLTDREYTVLSMGEVKGAEDVSVMIDGYLDVSAVVDAVDYVITANNPVLPLAVGNGTRTILLSVGSKMGIYKTQPALLFEIPILDDSILKNMNKISTSQYEEIHDAWMSFDVDKIVTGMRSL